MNSITKLYLQNTLKQLETNLEKIRSRKDEYLKIIETEDNGIKELEKQITEIKEDLTKEE